MRGLGDIGEWRHSRRSRRERRLRREALHQEQRVRLLEGEVEKLRRELELYKGMAYLDHLTGLRNRRYFEERLEQELSRARRSELPCSVLVADIDDFKRINDELGHATGDMVLRQVGKLFLESQRTMDIPCRIGGDEFAVILPATGDEGAEALRDRLHAAEPHFLDFPSLRVRLSYGIASYPATQDLVGDADRDMYADKRARKDTPLPHTAA